MYKYHLNFVDIKNPKSSGKANIQVLDGLSQAIGLLSEYKEETKAKKIKKSSYVEITKVLYDGKEPGTGKFITRKYVSDENLIPLKKEKKKTK
jgi:hypothetical protein